MVILDGSGVGVGCVVGSGVGDGVGLVGFAGFDPPEVDVDPPGEVLELDAELMALDTGAKPFWEQF